MDFLLFTLIAICTVSKSFAVDPPACTKNTLYKPQIISATDKTGYYICLSEEGLARLQRCPEGLTFTEGSFGCTIPITEETTDCTLDQTKFDDFGIGKCLGNKICKKDTGDPAKIEFTPNLCDTNSVNKAFDPYLGRCVDATVTGFKCPADATGKPNCAIKSYAGKLLTNFNDCQTYYECKNGARVKGTCPTGKRFDATAQVCVDKSKVACGSSSSTTNPCQGKKAGDFVADENYCKAYFYCFDEKTPYWNYCGEDKYFNNGFCSSAKPSTCKCEGIDVSGGEPVYVPNTDKAKYTVCEKDKAPMVITCPDGTFYDESDQSCA